MAHTDSDRAAAPAPDADLGAAPHRGYFDHSPIAILVADAAGRLVDANPAAAALTGYPPEALLGRSLAELAPTGGQAGFVMFQRVVDTGRAAGEIRMRRANGGVRWVLVEAVRLTPGRFVAFCRDVTEQRTAEEALRQERALFEQVMETSPVAIVTVDGAGRLTLVNRWAVEHLGVSRDVAGRRFDDPQWRLTAPDGGPLRAEELPFFRVMGTGATVRDVRLASEWPPGTRRQLSVNAAALRDPEGTPTGLVCVVEDVTERLAAERELQAAAEQLRSLASQASLAEERERRQVATELHDRIAQPLAMAKLRLRALLPRVADPACAGPVGEVCDLLDAALADIRGLTFTISSPILYDLGFEAALEWLAEQLQTRHGVACEFVDDGAHKPLADDLRVALYQSVRELTTNIVKHAAARTARIAVRRDGSELVVEVTDDGVGFTPTVPAARAGVAAGYGLFSVRERLRHLGASFALDSAPGRGTRVVLRAPVGPAGAPASGPAW